MDITTCEMFCFKMFYLKYYVYHNPVVLVVGLIFFHFCLWLWDHFSFYLKFREPVWSCRDVLKIMKVVSKYKLESFCHILNVMKGYLCFCVLKVFREPNEGREQVKTVKYFMPINTSRLLNRPNFS